MTTFPISIPATPRFREVDFGIQRVVGVTESPFELNQNIYAHPGAAWGGSVSLPQMSAAQGATWSAFAARLAGRSGTFLMAPPDRAAPFGTQSANFTVNGAHAERVTSLAVTMSVSATLLAGDRISIGQKLHEVVVDATADGAGAATLSIEPPLRVALTGGETVKCNPPEAEFRMMANDVRPVRNGDGTYSLAFEFREA